MLGLNSYSQIKQIFWQIETIMIVLLDEMLKEHYQEEVVVSISKELCIGGGVWATKSEN